MAIVNNTASEIGDVIFIQTNAPVIGLIALQSFTDVVGGETGARFWTKEFRYSLDGGLHWSDWILLTIPNVQAVPVVGTDTFQTEYRYTRAGTDPSDLLSFTEVEITGDTSAIPCGDAFNNSVFKEYFQCDDIGVLNWAVNVLEKMYLQGIVPRYVIRGEDNKARNDEDYVAYWLSVTTFFAYLVRFAREFENFYSNERLISEYIKQKDLFTCETDTLLGLQFVMNNMLREMRKRGSIKMYEPLEQSGNDAHGELLRLLCYDKDTEFILGMATQECATWNLDHTSPSYTGVGDCRHLVKGYEWTDNVEDLSKYPQTIQSGTITLEVGSAGGDLTEQDVFNNDGNAYAGTTDGISVWVLDSADVRKFDPSDWSSVLQDTGAGVITRRCIHARDSNNLVVGGDGSHFIQITSDGGDTWTDSTDDPSGSLKSVDADHGGTNIWVLTAFNNVYRSVDGGDHLTDYSANLNTPGLFAENIQGSALPTPSVCYLCGDAGEIEKSTNFDTSATFAHQVSSTSEILWAIYAFDATNVIAGGHAGKLVHTSDGSSWSTITTPATASDLIKGVYMVSAAIWVISWHEAGVASGAAITYNSGVTWDEWDGSTHRYFYDVVPVDASRFLTMNGTSGLTDFAGIELTIPTLSQVMRIDGVGIGDVAGIGDAAENPAKSLVVDPNYNYEITFRISAENTTDELRFGCLGFDINDSGVNLVNAQDGLDKTFFIDSVPMNIAGEWYFVRGIIWNAGQANEAGVTTNLGVGNNLRLKSTIVKIMPMIQIDNVSGGGVSGFMDLYDIRIKPVSLNYSHSYLDQGRWVDVIAKNKNGEMTNDEIEEQMRRKLIPYNTSFHNVYL